MRMIRLVATDIDGTLVDGNLNFPGNTMETLYWLNDQGIEVMLASGRSYEEALQVVDAVDFPVGCICYNGAQTRDGQGPIVESFPMDLSILQSMEKIHDRLPVILLYLTSDKTYCCESLEKYRRECLRFSVEEEGLPTDVSVKRFEEVVLLREIVFSCPFEEIPLDDVLKCEWLFLSPAQFSALAGELSEVKGIDFMTGGYFNNMEVIQSGVSKGKALRDYCLTRGISLNEIITLGDSENDVSMLEGIEYSVAMGQSPQSVKDKAGYVTGDIQDDGFTQAVRTIITNEK